MGRELVGWQVRSAEGVAEHLTASTKVAALVLWETARRTGVAALHPVFVELPDPDRHLRLWESWKAMATVGRV